MFTERTDQNIKMLKVISKHLLLLNEMYDIIVNVDLNEDMRSRFLKIEHVYHKLAEEQGAMIQEVTKIERSDESHYLFEDTYFSILTIKKLIKQGEPDKEMLLSKRG